MASDSVVERQSPTTPRSVGPFVRRKARKADERKKRLAALPVVSPAAENIEPSPWIIIGRVLKAFGLKGWVRIACMSDNPGRFAPEVVLRRCLSDGSQVTMRILDSRCSADGRFADLLLEDITNDEQARGLVGEAFVIPREERLPPPKGAYYADELVGMDVLSPAAEHEGRISSLEMDVPSPYLVIESTRLGEVLVPFRKVFIKKIDRKSRALTLNEPLEFHYFADKKP
ncbi:MAG: 16S rRNA processing protein RimM [Candidatus Riflebacteria bacterium]|nr:16S rRNA processing protein RimM [Candidatus Riflebacteria bacterium]